MEGQSGKTLFFFQVELLKKRVICGGSSPILLEKRVPGVKDSSDYFWIFSKLVGEEGFKDSRGQGFK